MTKIARLKPAIASLKPSISTGPKRADSHYQSPAHEAWSEAVKERDGWRCVDPAHDTSRPRHGEGVTLYADHVQELRDAPHLATVVANGMTRCAHCHGRKTASERARRYRQP